MRVPLSWLREFVALENDATPQSVHEALVRVGFEEEAVLGFEVSGPVVVGQVLEQHPEPQSNGKTINWCQVRVAPEGRPAADGGADVRGIVCGAHNFSVGDKVVVTLPGAVLPGNFRITPRKTYGHVSDGMMASAAELGLGDGGDGILVLSSLGLDPEVGEDAKALLGLDDSGVDINVTPDRGYALSIRGVAREYAHATGAAFTDPASLVPERFMGRGSGFDVAIVDDAPIRGQKAASVFVTRVVRGVDAKRPAPAHMRARLKLAGLRSISLIVDVTNYVMLELGQPIHAYDLSRLDGGLTVRRAGQGEHLTTLDGRDRALDVEDIVIADDSGPIGLAGVMGGETTEVSLATTDVLIEAANFSPISVARTQRRHRLPSEASKRFERGVDPEVAEAAAARVAQLLVELGGGTLDELGSALIEPAVREPIVLRLGDVTDRMGIDYSDDEMTGVLEAIGCELSDTPSTREVGGRRVKVAVPSWRPDLTEPVDLIEEIARVIGYDRLPAILPVAPAGAGLTREQRLRRTAADTLAGAGHVEVLTQPFTTVRANTRFASPSGDEVASILVANPLDATQPALRRSLLTGLVDAARRNLGRGTTSLSIFELGHVFVPRTGPDGESIALGTTEVPKAGERPSDEVLAAIAAGLPEQPRQAAGVAFGNAVEKQPGAVARAYDWADALDAVRALAAGVGARVSFRQGAHAAFHPGRCAEVLVRSNDGELPIGLAGQLHPDVTDELDLPDVVVAWCVDLDALIEHAASEISPEALASVPPATQDLSLVVPRSTPAGEVLAAVREGAGSLLEASWLVDDYRGQGVAEDEKSLTFALRFRAPGRTLTAAEASEAKEAGAAAAAERFGATIRA